MDPTQPVFGIVREVQVGLIDLFPALLADVDDHQIGSTVTGQR